MYQDGVCRVTPHTFSKCIEFTDISYQLAQADTKTAIFENLCDLYNYLDASIHVQFSFINRKIDPKQYAKSFEIRAQGDDFDDIRSQYSYHSPSVTDIGSRQPCVRTSWTCCCKMAIASCLVLQQVDVRLGLPVL